MRETQEDSTEPSSSSPDVVHLKMECSLILMFAFHFKTLKRVMNSHPVSRYIEMYCNSHKYVHDANNG